MRAGSRYAATPFWLDALIATIMAHLAFVVHLRFTGWNWMAAEYLLAPRELWWWGYFLPGFLILLFGAFRCHPHHRSRLMIGAFLLYVALAMCTPRFAP